MPLAQGKHQLLLQRYLSPEGYFFSGFKLIPYLPFS